MQTTCTSLRTGNHTNTASLNFYRPDALPDTYPTVSKHWRHHTYGLPRVVSSTDMLAIFPPLLQISVLLPSVWMYIVSVWHALCAISEAVTWEVCKVNKQCVDSILARHICALFAGEYRSSGAGGIDSRPWWCVKSWPRSLRRSCREHAEICRLICRRHPGAATFLQTERGDSDLILMVVFFDRPELCIRSYMWLLCPHTV